MAYDFDKRVNKTAMQNALMQSLGANLSEEDLARLNLAERNWNFYDGYHWEGIESGDKPQVTENLVRTFVDKFVSFELGAGFKISMEPAIESIESDDENPYLFLERVWEYNNRLEKSVELGQSKSITGDGWMQVSYESNEDDHFFDPFEEHEKGKIKVTVLPTGICFPKYSDSHNREHMESLTIMYPIEKEQKEGFIFSRKKLGHVMYKQVWTKDRVKVYLEDMREPIQDIPNKYGVIPFVQIKNFPQQGRNEGLSDVEDLIPLNTELNLKLSDISEIIDYHSAPITVVYGARVGQLERGAGKVWGGLPSDAKVENLRLEGDLNVANSYIDRLKVAMHEVGSLPESALGGGLAISNTSGVALQIALMPLLERVKIKQVLSKEGLEFVNKLILLIALKEGMLKIPEGVKRSDFFKNEVTFGSILPKDSLMELQEIETEMRLGLTSRPDAMKRRGKDHIQENITKIDEDMEENPALYGKEDVEKQLAIAEGQAKIQKENSPTPKLSGESTEKKVGVNKEGNPKQINAGFQNSPIPKK